MDWEKIVANNISDKELVSRIHKELSRLSSKETKISNYEMIKRHDERYCIKGDIWMANKNEKMFNIITH